MMWRGKRARRRGSSCIHHLRLLTHSFESRRLSVSSSIPKLSTAARGGLERDVRPVGALAAGADAIGLIVFSDGGVCFSLSLAAVGMAGAEGTRSRLAGSDIL